MKFFLWVIAVHFFYAMVFIGFDFVAHPDTFSGGFLVGLVLMVLVFAASLFKYNIFYALGYALLSMLMTLLIVFSMPGYELSGAESHSNLPTVQPNDLVVSRHFDGRYQRGDMIIFLDHQHQWMRKRIHGIPGDHILVCDDRVYVNHYHFSVQHHWQPVRFDTSQRCYRERQSLLGQDEFFVLGDNPTASQDSRDYGPILTSQIKYIGLYTVHEDSPLLGQVKATFLTQKFQTPE